MKKFTLFLWIAFLGMPAPLLGMQRLPSFDDLMQSMLQSCNEFRDTELRNTQGNDVVMRDDRTPNDPDGDERMSDSNLGFLVSEQQGHFSCDFAWQEQYAVRFAFESVLLPKQGGVHDFSIKNATGAVPYLIKLSQTNNLQALTLENIGDLRPQTLQLILAASAHTLEYFKISGCSFLDPVAVRNILRGGNFPRLTKATVGNMTFPMRVRVPQVMFSMPQAQALLLPPIQQQNVQQQPVRQLPSFSPPIFSLPDFSSSLCCDKPIKELLNACLKDVILGFGPTRSEEDRIKVSLKDLGSTIKEFKDMWLSYFDNKGKPYACKVILPDQDCPYKVVTIGDLHGSAYSLGRNLIRLQQQGYLDFQFRVLDNVRIVFLGDIADRGTHNILTWYTLMKFALYNKGKVLICRGNHETAGMARHFKFDQEIRQAYGLQDNLFFANGFLEIFAMLPLAIYLGTRNDLIHFGHGGLPVQVTKNPSHGPNARCTYFPTNYTCSSFPELLTDESKTAKVVQDYEGNAFFTLDFHARNGDITVHGSSGRFQFPESRVREFYRGSPVRCIFRGHQHNNSAVSMLNGGTEWKRLSGDQIPLQQNRVYTFMSCPEQGLWGQTITPHDAGVGGWCFTEGFGVVTIQGEFARWRLKVCHYNCCHTKHDFDEDRDGRF